MRALTRDVKNIVPRIVQDGGDGGSGGAGGGGGQASESRFWEAEIPAFIERCMSSSITDPQALPAINDLFMVSRELIHLALSVYLSTYLSVLSVCCYSNGLKCVLDETKTRVLRANASRESVVGLSSVIY